MDAREQAAMQQHMGYWQELTHKGSSILYGPVFDPKGVYGMAVVEVADAASAEQIAQGDPAVASGICSYEMIPMQIGLMREGLATASGFSS